MKIYKYIVVDKNNMKTLTHYSNVEELVWILACKNLEQMIVIKDENMVLKFPTLIGAPIEKTSSIREILINGNKHQKT